MSTAELLEADRLVDDLPSPRARCSVEEYLEREDWLTGTMTIGVGAGVRRAGARLPVPG